ncbi:hypothetical protein NNO22_10485 [Enterococcus faecium]|nr:hypothetical protein [Enterococcus faecium]MDT6682349.1 hypothetical protein [Enterococcus faecium]MDT6761421.1 hypothetical protein [Enterococcus faecium]
MSQKEFNEKKKELLNL